MCGFNWLSYTVGILELILMDLEPEVESCQPVAVCFWSKTTMLGPFPMRYCIDTAETGLTFPSSSPQSKKSIINFLFSRKRKSILTISFSPQLRIPAKMYLKVWKLVIKMDEGKVEIGKQVIWNKLSLLLLPCNFSAVRNIIVRKFPCNLLSPILHFVCNFLSHWCYPSEHF